MGNEKIDNANKKPAERVFVFLILGKVGGNQLGHLEHIDHFLSAKHRRQGRIGIDVAFVLGVLQICSS